MRPAAVLVSVAVLCSVAARLNVVMRLNVAGPGSAAVLVSAPGAPGAVRLGSGMAWLGSAEMWLGSAEVWLGSAMARRPAGSRLGPGGATVRVPVRPGGRAPARVAGSGMVLVAVLFRRLRVRKLRALRGLVGLALVLRMRVRRVALVLVRVPALLVRRALLVAPVRGGGLLLRPLPGALEPVGVP